MNTHNKGLSLIQKLVHVIRTGYFVLIVLKNKIYENKNKRNGN